MALTPEIESVIVEAATRHGVDPAAALRTAEIESGFDPKAANKSGASGLFQFMPGTAKEYALADPFDAKASSDAAMRLWTNNAKHLSSTLGRDPSPAELYLAHQQGAGGAAKLLGNPDAPAASLVGQAAVVQNGGRPDMSAREFAGLWLNKFGGGSAPKLNGFGTLARSSSSSSEPLMLSAVESSSSDDDAKAAAALLAPRPQNHAEETEAASPRAPGILSRRRPAPLQFDKARFAGLLSRKVM